MCIRDRFEDETGISVIYDVFETNEEMYPVVEAGGVKYDVVCPSDYMIQRMIDNNILAELDYDNIPNADQIGDPYWKMSQGFDPDNKYSVPVSYTHLDVYKRQVYGSLHTQARMPFTLFAAKEIPTPVPQIAIPRSASPEATARPTFSP